MSGPRIGVYPGTFDPPTVAHVAIAEAAVLQGGLDRLDVAVSQSPLGKSDTGIAALHERVRLLDAIAETRPWLFVMVTEGLLISEIASGYDAVVLGADKWRQVVDPGWYGGSVASRDAAVSGLPQVLLAPRHGYPPAGLPPGSVVLDLPTEHWSVSSTAVREGRVEWVASEVTGLWRPSEG